MGGELRWTFRSTRPVPDLPYLQEAGWQVASATPLTARCADTTGSWPLPR